MKDYLGRLRRVFMGLATYPFIVAGYLIQFCIEAFQVGQSLAKMDVDKLSEPRKP